MAQGGSRQAARVGEGTPLTLSSAMKGPGIQHEEEVRSAWGRESSWLLAVWVESSGQGRRATATQGFWFRFLLQRDTNEKTVEE